MFLIVYWNQHITATSNRQPFMSQISINVISIIWPTGRRLDRLEGRKSIMIGENLLCIANGGNPVTRQQGVMKKTCIKPSAVALRVSSKIQIVSAKMVMFVASTEMIWPSQTIVKPNIPVGRLSLNIYFSRRRITAFKKSDNPPRRAA